MAKKSDVPPGSSSNPPKVRAALRQACEQIQTIQEQLDQLKETLQDIDCGKHKKK